jgi:hypothetical protein
VEDKSEREPVRVLMPGKGWVSAELLYERDGHCRVQVPGDKPRTVLASRVKRTSKLAASALITMANKAAEVGAGAEAYLAIAKGDLSAAVPFVDAMREADGATDDSVMHARLHAEVFPESPALRPVFADSPALRAVPKPPKPMRDAKYMAWVRDQHCCCVLGCGLAANEAHHHGPRGMGQKTHDQLVLPMCARCHREFHDTGTVNGMTREDFDAFASRVQVGLMLDYYRDELGMFGTADLREVANALVEALRGER